MVGAGAGEVTAFASSLVHGGAPVTEGTRYILVLFLWAEGCDATGGSGGGGSDGGSKANPLDYSWLGDEEGGGPGASKLLPLPSPSRPGARLG